jgi:molybdopterin-guanine dinucleotide biosynthesis protein A
MRDMRVPITGAILLGGDSRRMGRDKASLPWQGENLLTHVHGILAPLCGEVLLVTRLERVDAVAASAGVGGRVVADRLPGRGPLVGIHAALSEAAHERILVVGVDMPWLNAELLAALIQEGDGDAVVPRTERGWEPLHAVYSRACLPVIEKQLAGGAASVTSFFGEVRIQVWTPGRWGAFDPTGRSFRSVNSPEDIPV